MEHITTRDAAEFVAAAPPTVAATVTPQHMLLNRNALFVGGLRPHAFCLPILKREEHRQAVAGAATSGSSKFFLGTDSGEGGARGRRRRAKVSRAQASRAARRCCPVASDPPLSPSSSRA